MTKRAYAISAGPRKQSALLRAFGAAVSSG